MSERPEWFAPKRFGYGAGWPIAWQGWAVFLAALAIVLFTGWLLEDHPALQFAIILPVIIVLAVITAATTRGGWRWRWGGDE